MLTIDEILQLKSRHARRTKLILANDLIRIWVKHTYVHRLGEKLIDRLGEN